MSGDCSGRFYYRVYAYNCRTESKPSTVRSVYVLGSPDLDPISNPECDGEYWVSWSAVDDAQGYELQVIAAAVIGGASLLGGRGTVFGAMLGAMVIALIENGIFILKKVDLGLFTFGLSQEYKMIILGTAIIIAVAVDRLTDYLHSRRLTAGPRGQRDPV